jgi:hypothetical protein
MSLTANSLLALTIVSLGILGVILSFLVPDTKRSRIALFLSFVIIGVGALEFVSQAVRQYMWQRKLDEIRKQQAVNLDQLKQRLQQGEGGATNTPGPANSK